MAQFTLNYNLKKPGQTDFYNVDDFNQNADAVDTALKDLQDNKAALVDGVVPAEQLPPMDYDPSGTATGAVAAHNLSLSAHADIRENLAEGLGGKADLAGGVVPVEQLPPMDYDPSGTAAEAVNEHNASLSAHADIRDSMAEGLSGKADLAGGVVPVEQLPPMDYDPSGTAAEAVNEHNASLSAHADIRESLAELETEITAAQNTANTANTAAQAAQNTANSAQNTANTANTAAQAAQTAASNAQATANTASTVANAKANKNLSNVSSADFAAKATEAGIGGATFVEGSVILPAGGSTNATTGWYNQGSYFYFRAAVTSGGNADAVVFIQPAVTNIAGVNSFLAANIVSAAAYSSTLIEVRALSVPEDPIQIEYVKFWKGV